MSETKATTLRELLSRDHARLDAVLKRVLELVHGGSSPELYARWATYEGGLLAHLDAEEMFLLPGVKKHDPACAAHIFDDHARTRELLAEIGIGLELHMVREAQVRELERFLEAHAAMEERPLYTWADASLPHAQSAAVFRRFAAVFGRTAPSPHTANSFAQTLAAETPT